jgi:hypothetical protein
MATVVNFFGRRCIEPGSYAAMRYSPHSVVNVAEFGNVMIIDTGLSLDDHNSDNAQVEFAGGAGVMGVNASGIKSVYAFDNITDFENFMGGGLVTDIARKIFTPREGVAGAPKLYYARAAKTSPAEISINNGDILLKCKNEGTVGNGIIDSVNSKLQVGYSAKIVAGTIDPAKFKLQVRKGTYAGTDKDGEAFNGIAWGDAEPIVIYESGEFTDSSELYDEMIHNQNMVAEFKIEFTNNNPLSLQSETLSSGGVTIFDTQYYSEVLEAVEEMDITFFLCTNLKVDKATDSDSNGKLFTFLKTRAKYTEFMFVPGGADKNEFATAAYSSKSTAAYYNSNQVVVVHGAPEVDRKDGNGTKTLYPIYLTASIMGMNAGLAPQTPLTFKRVGYEAFNYDLTRTERENALKWGIMHVRNVSGYWCVNQGINTIQYPDNLQTLNQNSESFELSIELIKAQMNKEITMDAQRRFTGLTAAQASPASVKTFTETKLNSFVAEVGADNLIIRWRNVTVTVNNSDYTIYYDFVPNVPVNKTFFIGNILDFTL